MTDRKARTTDAAAHNPEARPTTTEEHEALDAEIVAALDADGEAGEARGGGCPSSVRPDSPCPAR